ncbi:hypothetical protein K3174_06225 [Qipengyuania sp. 6D47A]|uniref:Uncharacterized protein n=1 Tax=Qipengyuania qiaonensis TaxID=2867240 RepID=A0ABS7J459_9SPHN|nr:hypothetical protein [Qipengyuania qiaonensis]
MSKSHLPASFAGVDGMAGSGMQQYTCKPLIRQAVAGRWCDDPAGTSARTAFNRADF